MPKHEDELLYGRHLVLQYLESGQAINKVFLQKGLSGGQIEGIVDLVKQHRLVLSQVPKTKLDELTDGANHQGVVITTPPIPYQSLEDCFQLAQEHNEPPFFILLDGIEDPHNLGSILRTANATGVHGVIIPKRRAVGLTGIVAKTSAGAIEHVPVVRVTNLSDTIRELKERGLWIFASAMDGEDMRQWNSEGAIGLIIGNEGSGVSPNILKQADGIVKIPMTGEVESLNASVAAAVLMYEVARERLD